MMDISNYTPNISISHSEQAGVQLFKIVKFATSAGVLLESIRKSFLNYTYALDQRRINEHLALNGDTSLMLQKLKNVNGMLFGTFSSVLIQTLTLSKVY